MEGIVAFVVFALVIGVGIAISNVFTMIIQMKFLMSKRGTKLMRKYLRSVSKVSVSMIGDMKKDFDKYFNDNDV